MLVLLTLVIVATVVLVALFRFLAFVFKLIDALVQVFFRCAVVAGIGFVVYLVLSNLWIF